MLSDGCESFEQGTPGDGSGQRVGGEAVGREGEQSKRFPRTGQQAGGPELKEREKWRTQVNNEKQFWKSWGREGKVFGEYDEGSVGGQRSRKQW